ncbi:MAG: deoxyribodipyrimidine photo-lyase, partial [Pseudomonadota bacterium]
MPCLLWFRQDLRLTDNPALLKASEHDEIIPVFILDETDRTLGGAS